ncbi:TRAP-type mannitol/chloroaromatic compound transport system permease small subunit [Hydrogenophaga palleronii]|uniref:TRAP transporter small permease protein n=1 Tax=Hydrogenophaga palleronii TaxID=65655 RepID=A0ABU1WS86_9BURK|nr:TRAP transporter small permease [Hydrogenophaga palleronii]MDR7152168.1 TRAP-type mannitol/chloroaromatic compound transport system permease small subunit [Hydrogenophaga palleronii]
MSQPTPGDGGAVSRVDAAPQDAYNQSLPFGLHRLTQGLNALGTLIIIGLMLLINTDIVGRTGFDAPVRGVTELVSLSIVGIVFLQLADTLRSGRFTRADMLLDRLKRNRPVLAAVLQAIYHGLGAVLMGIILWAAWPSLVESIRIREYVGALGDFTAPVWPVRLMMLVGLSVTALTFVLLASMDLRRARSLAQSASGVRS